MAIKNEQAKVEEFQKIIVEDCGEDISYEDSKARYYELLNLYWILGHRPPASGESPYTPPPPPWL